MIIVIILSVGAAVLGSTTLMAVVLPSVSYIAGTTPATMASTSVFGW